MSMATISVIVPCYSQAQYLPEALDSVIAQTYANWECIIVNDGSTDNTEQVALGYCAKDARFKYIKKENGGLSSARNAGINDANGEYILPLDADDLIGPHYIEKALEVFKNFPNTALVYSKAKLFGVRNEVWPLRPYTYRELLKSNMIFCSAIFRKIDFIKTGSYDEQLTTGYEDWDFYIRLLNADSAIHQLNDFHFYYRIKSDSMLQSITPEKQQELHDYLYIKHIKVYRTYFDSAIGLLQKTDKYESMYKNSYDYKLGNALLNPLRWMLRLRK